MRGIRLPFSNQLLPSQDLEKLETIEGVDSMASSLLLWEFDKSGFERSWASMLPSRAWDRSK